MPGLADYHIHTSRCGHASGTIAEYVEQARARGLAEIGFSDHLPLWHTIDATLAMSWDEFPLYMAEINKLKEDRGSPRVKLGIEADYIPEHIDRTAEILADYDFDYVMGSVHFIDGWGFDDRRYSHLYDAYEISDLYERYFNLLIEAAGTGLFDIMAHPDLVKKYHRMEPEPISLYEKTAAALADAGVCIEVSSAGLRKPCREIYPSHEFLKICRAHDVPVTLGSDAHTPDQVGDEFNELVNALREAGYTEITIFDGRRRRMEQVIG